MPGLLGPTSWSSHRADLRFRNLSALNRRMEIILLWSGIVD
jgi:hypothetical protein